MADTVSTGTVAQSGTRLYVVGTASGMDTTALVDAAYDQKVAKADSIDIRIEGNQAEIAAYQTLQELGNDLATSLTALKASYGYSTSNTSIYDDMTAYLSTSDGADASGIIGMTVDSTAAQGSYSIEVIQLAKAMKISSGLISSKSDALNMEGTFSLSLGSGTSVDIQVTAAMSLQDIASALNATTGQTGISASIIKTSDNSYSLILTAKRTGEDINVTHVAGDNVFEFLGLTDSNNDFVTVVQGAQSAIIEIDGVQATSSTNSFTNITDGISLTLYAESLGTIITAEIDYDYSATKDAILAFIDAYNALRDFVIQNQQVGSDGAVSEDAVLYGDSLLKSLNSQISSILTASGNTASAISNLGDLGITFDSDNKLTVSNETTLNNALLDNYTSLRSFFETSISADSASISLIRNSSTGNSLDIAFDIQVDGNGQIVSVSANGDSNTFDINGTLLTGKSGTAYEGLTFAYVGGISTQINVSLQQGIADQIYNAINSYTNTATGTIQSTILRIEGTNTQLDTEAERIRERADAFREKEITRYANMEAKVQAAENLLKTVRALLGTSEDE
jgi:flagellar hook-associated protein 2